MVCYWQLEDVDNFNKYFDQLMDFKLLTKELESYSYGIKAHFLSDQKKYKEAKEYYKKAMDLAEDEEDKERWKSYRKLQKGNP